MPTPPDMPPQPKTRELPAMTDRALLEDLGRAVKDGFRQVDEHLLDFGERLVRVEIRQKDLEERMGRNSQRVAGESETNAKQDAAIAHVLVRVDDVEKKLVELGSKADVQTQILTRLETGATALVKHPRVQLLVGILWTALLAYLASKGLVH